MDENPYQSPKEASSPPIVKAGVALGVLLMMAIPAGCICGGVTCSAIGLYSQRAPGVIGPEDTGLLVAIVTGLVVVVVIPLLAVQLFGKKKDGA